MNRNLGKITRAKVSSWHLNVYACIHTDTPIIRFTHSRKSNYSILPSGKWWNIKYLFRKYVRSVWCSSERIISGFSHTRRRRQRMNRYMTRWSKVIVSGDALHANMRCSCTRCELCGTSVWYKALPMECKTEFDARECIRMDHVIVSWVWVFFSFFKSKNKILLDALKIPSVKSISSHFHKCMLEWLRVCVFLCAVPSPHELMLSVLLLLFQHLRASNSNLLWFCMSCEMLMRLPKDVYPSSFRTQRAFFHHFWWWIAVLPANEPTTALPPWQHTHSYCAGRNTN